ncbi:hypothetical protein [Nocardia mexicana]|uniref:Uncharacterized protein n=1 Tax=Nocardia mexicana TaxID=279262 RepID=A0A370HDI1_9NOCA|nr:hypothetical protein [Nocardia mexicana]RDI54475.1 hypothetical protein DFR68_102603 [Nocardia mexicana]
MRKWTKIAVTLTGYALAVAVFPISAEAQAEPVEIDNSQVDDARKPHDCHVTSKRYGKNGSISGKCKGSGKFQIRNLCYKTSSLSSDSEFIWGGRADAPDDTSAAVCRGSYPYMNTDEYVAFWRV